MPFDNYADLAALHPVRVFTTPFLIIYNSCKKLKLKMRLKQIWEFSILNHYLV